MYPVASTVLSTLFIAAALSASPTMAQTYPTKAIRLIVPTTPGGGYDMVGRLLSEKLASELGQSFVVENRTGAGTVVGSQVAASAPADGYTLLVGGLANIAFNPGLYSKLPYSSSDFTPIALVGSFSYTLIARKSLAQSTLPGIISFARENPEKLSIAIAGNGTGQHVAAALLKHLAKIKILEISYKGALPAYTDLLGDRVDLFFDNTATARPFIESDRVKAIVTSSPGRDSSLPQVPTGQEAGLDGLVLESWIGLFAPAKTPQPVVDKLRAALTKVMQTPELRKNLENYGVRITSMTTAETDRFIKAEVVKWPDFLHQAGIKAD